jgi:alpha-methylacyl-CoA racemase
MNVSLASSRSGPLAGLRVVEFSALGPGPFACMLLSDMGADVVTVDRPGVKLGDRTNIVGRGRTVMLADLKNPASRDEVLELIERADALVEGFRPGVMERLGLGPDVVASRNPKLVYGRMTGWGQHGPLAQAAGHDINYIALTGALHAIGPEGGAPVPPLNLVGDYGGGSMYLVMGILAALLEVHSSGRGQVVDAAITDGTNSLMSLFWCLSQRGMFQDQRAGNLLDGGAPFYGVYETADGRHMSVGSIEPQFFADMCQRLNVNPGLRDAQYDKARWGALKAELTGLFRSKTRDEWASVFDGTDACVAPVLALKEVPLHPQNAHRQAFVELDGVRHPIPAPRFSRTPSAIQGAQPAQATPSDEIMARWSVR